MPNKQVTPTPQPETGGARACIACGESNEMLFRVIVDGHVYFYHGDKDCKRSNADVLVLLMRKHAATKGAELERKNELLIQTIEAMKLTQEAAELSLSKMRELLRHCENFIGYYPAVIIGGKRGIDLAAEIRAALEPPSGGEKSSDSQCGGSQ